MSRAVSRDYPAPLTMFVPTRGRPHNLSSFVDEFDEVTSPNTKLVFIYDEDDPFLDSYLDARQDVEFYVAPETTRGMVGALNSAFRAYRDRDLLGFAVGFMGDDHRPRTYHWDSVYLERLQDMRSGFVYGNDLLQGELMPTQVAFTTDIALALSYMSPPELHHLCVDLVWRDLGREIGKIEYLPDVIVEHMHPLAGKAKEDKNYKAVNNNTIARHDSQAYNDYIHGERFQEDLGRIRMVMENGYYEAR